jgi:tetratricopeptide (TPR) repeat protein
MRRSLLLAALLHVATFSATSQAELPAAVESQESADVSRAVKMILDGHPKEAMSVLDTVIAANQSRHSDRSVQVYCARSPAETLVYMAEAAAAGRSAIAEGITWCDAIFFKGYALIDLGQPAEARKWYERAVAMAPHNAHYKGELAETYKAARDWDKAYALFEETAADAQTYSPNDIKNFDLGRGWRGMGFVLIEQGKLKEAQAIFEKCLALDPNDEKAKNELRYIEGMKAKRTAV